MRVSIAKRGWLLKRHGGRQRQPSRVAAKWDSVILSPTRFNDLDSQGAAMQEPEHSTGTDLAPTKYGLVTSRMVTSLQATRPWVLLLANLAVAGAVLAAAAAAAIAVVGGRIAPAMGGLGAIVMAIFYLLAAAVHAALAFKLRRYARAIAEVGPGSASRAIERALAMQHGFFRLVGILVIGYLALCVVAVLTAATAGAWVWFAPT